MSVITKLSCEEYINLVKCLRKKQDVYNSVIKEQEEHDFNLRIEAQEDLDEKLEDLCDRLNRLGKLIKDGLQNDLIWELNDTILENESVVEGIVERYTERFKELFNMEEIEEILNNV